MGRKGTRVLQGAQDAESQVGGHGRPELRRFVSAPGHGDHPEPEAGLRAEPSAPATPCSPAEEHTSGDSSQEVLGLG